MNTNSTNKTPKSRIENETAFLGALLLEGRPVRRLPKFHKLTPAHFSDPLHRALFTLLSENFQFAKTDKIQTRAEILKSKPAFANVPDHRAFLDTLTTAAGFPLQALDALLRAGPCSAAENTPAIEHAPAASPESQPAHPLDRVTLPDGQEHSTGPFHNSESNQSSMPTPFRRLASSVPNGPSTTLHYPIRRKMRSDCVFAKLTPDQHLQLQSWLRDNSYAKTLELVAKPTPEGFGIKTHITSLHRYYYATLHDDLLDTRLDIGAQFQDLAALCEADLIAYRIITNENLERRLMELSSEPQADLKKILPLLRLLQRNQEFEFRKRQFELKHGEPKPKTSLSVGTADNETVQDLAGATTISTTPSAPPVPEPETRDAANPLATIDAADSVNEPCQSEICGLQSAVSNGKPVDFHAISQSCTLLHDNFSNLLDQAAI